MYSVWYYCSVLTITGICRQTKLSSITFNYSFQPFSNWYILTQRHGECGSRVFASFVADASKGCFSRLSMNSSFSNTDFEVEYWSLYLHISVHIIFQISKICSLIEQCSVFMTVSVVVKTWNDHVCIRPHAPERYFKCPKKYTSS
jgi:hypothetical protein